MSESSSAPRIEKLSVKNLRSIGDDRVTVRFPDAGALVLLEENNAGKSNITRGLEIIFGDQWPGTRRLEDHDFHGRDSDGIAIEVGAAVSGIPCPYCTGGEAVHFKWTYDPDNPGRDGNPVGYTFTCSNQYCGKTWPNNTMRTALAAAVLDADRRLDYQLSYASKYTMLSKLTHRFHERLLRDPQRKAQLVGVFHGLLQQFGAVPEFARFKELLASTAEDFGQNLPYRLDVDFSAYDPSNYFRSLRIHPSLDGEVRSFDELGTGQSQVLALAFAYAYAIAYGQSEGTVLVIAEPEANLHPLAQRWLATRLNQLAAPGLQVVITTHSPHFVDLARPENLVMVTKGEEGATRIVQRSREELRDELVRPRRRPCPYPARHHRAVLCGWRDHGDHQWTLCSPMRSGRRAHRSARAAGVAEGPWIRRSQGGSRCGVCRGRRQHRQVVPAVHRTRHRVLLPVRHRLEQERKGGHRSAGEAAGHRGRPRLSGDPAEPAALFGDPLHVSTSYATLDPNFEGAMTTLFGDEWTRLHEEAVASVGESKPLRARYAAQRLDEFDWVGDPASRIDALVRAIRGNDPDEGSEPQQFDDPWRDPSPWDAAPDPWADEEPPF